MAPSPFLGFLAAAAIAIVLLLGYVQLNGVYAETVKLQDQLVELQDQGPTWRPAMKRSLTWIPWSRLWPPTVP